MVLLPAETLLYVSTCALFIVSVSSAFAKVSNCCYQMCCEDETESNEYLLPVHIHFTSNQRAEDSDKTESDKTESDKTESDNSDTDSSNSSDTDKTCVICLDTIQSSQESILLSCNHIYHSRCILSWFQSDLTCPTCRAPIDAR